MLLRPPSCCRAMQRQLLPSSESIWVSDEILLSSFTRFCAISRTSRRHGSSVPGPMESRRRLGKRRMAHVSEAASVPVQDLGLPWGSFGAVDRNQWQWEAPTARATSQTGRTASLPTWLAEWDNTTLEDAPKLQSTEIPREGGADYSGTVEQDLNRFRETIVTATPEELHTICDNFNQRFKQSLRLGLVVEASLLSILQGVTKSIRKQSTDRTLAADLCTSFYLAIWEGITACKVLQPVDIDGAVMEKLLSMLADLPSTSTVQRLVRDILHSVSTSQLQVMMPGIRCLVDKWTHSWLNNQPIVDCTPSLLAAEHAVVDVDYFLIKLHQVVQAVEEGSTSSEGFVVAQDALSQAKLGVSLAMAAVVKAGNTLWPLKESIDTLADALGTLPPELMSEIVRYHSDKIIQGPLAALESSGKPIRDIRYYWLSTIAKIQSAETELLLDIWLRMEPRRAAVGFQSFTININPLTTSETSDLILSHWISRGYITDMAAVRNSFEISVLSDHNLSQGFELLIQTIDKHREMGWTRTKDLFDLLQKVNKHEAVYTTLLGMANLGLKIPASLLSSVINSMSSHSPRLAYRIYRIYDKIRYDNVPLRLDGCSDFVISMINDPKMTPKAIWSSLRIPLYEDLDMGPFRKPSHSPKSLPRSRIDLIHKMAMAFARAECRPHRVALRNVMQCASYLRVHSVPVTPDLTRAIAFAGITREIIKKQWVGTERLRWALELISWVEGKDVAKTIDTTVNRWRQGMVENQQVQVEKQMRECRERNVLKVGPID